MQLYWAKLGNPMEGGQKAGTNRREWREGGGERGERGSRAKPGNQLVLYIQLAGVPVGGKLSVCLIWNCMKYRIIILIIIIKRLGEILLSYMANTSHTHARTHPVSMYFPSQHFMILLVDDVHVVSSRRPITPEIHLLSLTIFTQEALVTLICMNLSVSYPNWYELK